MNKIFAICDTDRLYVKNLIQYMNSRQKIPLKLQAFTSPELLKEFAARNTVELLLISAEAMDEEITGLEIGKIVVLTEDGAVGLKGFPSVNRYQASGSLVQEVMAHYETGNLAVAYAAAKMATTHLIGVYSPIKRCGKTAFSLALGAAYAKSSRVLYVNLEDFSGFRSLLGRDYRMDISDLLYFYREEKQGMLGKVEEVTEKLYNISYLPPAICPADIKSVQPEEWKEWFMLLLQSRFEVIIVEPGDCVNGLEEILALCSRIYMPVRKDKTSAAKLKEYEEYLQLAGWEGLAGKMVKQLMPWIEEAPEHESLEGECATDKGLFEYMESEELKQLADRLVREEEYG